MPDLPTARGGRPVSQVARSTAKAAAPSSSRLRTRTVGVHKCTSAGGRGKIMLFRTLTALLVLAIGGLAISAGSQAKERGRNQSREPDANWVLIATRTVDLKKEEDRIDVGAGKGRFI